LFELALRIGFSLLVVFGLMCKRASGNLAVLTRQALSRGSSVAVVQVADRALILGVTEAHISLLGETELAAFEHEGLHLFGHHDEHGAATHERRDPVALTPDDVLRPGHPTVLPHHGGKLEGSVLSPRSWSSTLNFLRDRTARH
jgi:flagellar protein FliO/FliZ